MRKRDGEHRLSPLVPRLTWGALTPCQEQKWETCYLYDTRQAPAGSSSCVISGGSRMFWHAVEKVLSKAQPSPGWSSAGRHGATWGEVATLFLTLTHTSLWGSWQKLRQTGSNFVLPFMSLFPLFYCLSLRLAAPCKHPPLLKREESCLSSTGL